MRIALATVPYSHLNTLGGGERVTLELMRHLSMRHDVVLWAGGFRREDTYADLARSRVVTWRGGSGSPACRQRMS